MTPRDTTPILVGIGGDSGTGKSTVAAAFYDLFGADRITTVCLDDYHSLDRRQRALVELTPLNPRANNFALMEEHILAMKRGESIEKPVYRHSDGTFGPEETVVPREVVIVQGLHPFLVSGIRNAFDLKVWLDPEVELRIAWKLQRDTQRRGYTADQVSAELEARRPDADSWITPQRRHSDMVVHFFRPAPELRDMGHLNVSISQRHTLPRLAFDREIDDAQHVTVRRDVDDIDRNAADVIDIDGRIDAAEAEMVENAVWTHIDARHHHMRRVPPERLGEYRDTPDSHHSDPLALTQLILAHRILSAQRSLLVRVPADAHAEFTGEHSHT